MPGIEDSRCILVTGATSGIGRSLALSIAQLPSEPTVIAVGRRQERLDDLAKLNLRPIKFDVNTDQDAIKTFVDRVVEENPDLDTILLSAGIQHEFYFKKSPIDISKLTAEMNVNYTSVVTMITYLLPHFLKLGRPSFIIPVTSGLGIVPAPWVANYSASKAALHSFCLSLRMQLRGTNVHILEIIPPLVESELHDANGTTETLSKFWMPLNEYTKVTMDGLKMGLPSISCSTALGAFERFDRGKEEIVQTLQQRHEAVAQ